MARFWQNIDPTDCFLLSETIKISQILFWCKICQEQEHYIEPLCDKFNLSKTNFYRLWSCPWGGVGWGGWGGYVWRQRLFGISSQANKLDMVQKPKRFWGHLDSFTKLKGIKTSLKIPKWNISETLPLNSGTAHKIFFYLLMF